MKKQKPLRLGAVPAALLAMFGAAGDALADDEITELTEPKSSISIGAGYWTDDRGQSGKYDGMSEGKTYGLFDASIIKRDNDTGTWFKLDARNLGIDGTRSIQGEVLRQGNWGIGLGYRRISREDPNTYRTNLQGAGSWRLIQENSYASTATDYANQTSRFAPQMKTLKLGTTREQTNFNIYKNLMRGLDLTVTFKNEEKNGTRNWSRGGGQGGYFGVEPIDSTTRQLETALSYATEKFQLRGGYNASWYQNNVANKLVFFAPEGVPYGNTASTNTYLSLPLDNEAHQLYLNGGYNFTKNTRATLKMEYARATQNDRIPTAGIAGLSLANVPNRLDARVDTKLVQLGLNSRITKNFTLNANLRYHDRDDKTPIDVNYVNNTSYPYTGSSVRTLSGKAEGTFRFGDGYSLIGSIEEKRQKREQPVLADGTEKERVVAFRRDLDETTTRLELRRSMSETLNGSVSWVHAERDGSAYELMEQNNVTVGGITYDMARMINPMSIANRTRDKIRLSTDWAPTDNTSLLFVIEDGRDRYGGDNAYGLENGKTRLYGVDASWTLSDKLQLNAWYSYDQSKARQTGFLTSAGTRQYDLKDGANSVGLGVTWDATPRLRTGANMEWMRSVSKYNTSVWDLNGNRTSDPGVATIPAAQITAGASTDLPDITNRRLRLSWFAQYAINKSSDLRLDAIYDHWKTDDWTWQYNDGAPFIMGDGTYVTGKPTQRATYVGVRYIYRFH